uniref:Transcription factor E2F8 n=1 Tax=Cyprinus carpio TaxID=7962 RepID=A0A8C1RSL0_CYPCA
FLESHKNMGPLTTPTKGLEISRKDKSLGLLCYKFLASKSIDDQTKLLISVIKPCFINLNCLSEVERRRIYDIMNVLESLNMVSRLAKNRYTWHGRVKLAQTLAMLKRAGRENRYGQLMQQIRQRNCSEIM